MNVADLNKIDIKDLKNINLEQLRNIFQARPELLINIVLVIVTLILILIWNAGYKNTSAKTAMRIAELEAKIKVVTENNSVQKNTNDFVNAFPAPVTAEQLVNRISDVARSRHIQIQSLTPADEKDLEFWKVINLNVNVFLSDYKEVIQFIHDIESLPAAIQIENWSARARENVYRRNTETVNKTFLDVTIKLGAITIKK